MIVPLAILRGYVLMKLWQWFVVVQFGLAGLSWPIAIGLGTLIGYITITSVPYTDDSKTFNERMATACVFSVVIAVVTLLSGYVTSLFI